MKNTTVRFVDRELGDKLISFTYDARRYDFVGTMNLAMDIFYLNFEVPYETLRKEHPALTKELYGICMEILHGGAYGVTTDRFCEFMHLAFGWNYYEIKESFAMDIYDGVWN